MTEAARLHVTVSGDIADFTKKLERAAAVADEQLQVVGRAAAAAAPGLAKAEKAADEAGRAIGRIDDQAASVGDSIKRSATTATTAIGKIDDEADKVGKGVQQAADKAGKALSGIDNAAAEAARGVDKLGHSFKANLLADLASEAIMAFGRAAFDAGKRALGLAGELEQNKVAFTTMLGSATKADAFLRELAAFAASTPFELRGLQDSSKKLLAFGFNAKDIIPIMTGVGNAVAGVGGGKEVLDGVTIALGQMAAKGKVSAEEMGQLAERGIPAWDMLAKAVGKSTAQVQADVTAGAISANVAIEALVNGMNERFPNMMEQQSKTLLGAWSNLADGVDGFLTRIGMGIVSAFDLTDVIATVSAALSGMNQVIDQHGLVGLLEAIFSPAVQAAILGVGTAITAYVVPPLLSAIPAAAAAAWTAIAGATAAFAPFIAAGVAVAALAYPLIKNWDIIPGYFSSLWSLVEAKTLEWYQSIVGVARNVQRAFQVLAQNIVAFLGPVWDGLKGHVNNMIAGLPQIVRDKVGDWTGAFKGWTAAAGSAVAALPGAIGKHVSAATSSLSASFQVEAMHIGTIMTAAGNQVKGYFQGIVGDMSGLASTLGAEAGKFALTGAKAADAAGKAAGKGAKAAATEGEKAAKRIQKAFEGVAPALEAVGRTMGDAFTRGDLAGAIKAAGKEVSILEAAMTKLTKEGVAESAPAFKKLGQALDVARGRLDALKRSAEDVKASEKALAKYRDVYDDLERAMTMAGAKGAAMGKGFDVAAADASALERAMNSLLEMGLKPTGVEVQALHKRWQEAGRSSAAFKKQLEVGKTLEDLEKQLGEVRSQTEAFGRSCVDSGDLVKAYETAIAKLARNGTPEARAELELLRAKLDEVKGGWYLAAEQVGVFQEKTNGVLGGIGSLASNLKTLAGEGLGAGFIGPVAEAAAKMNSLGGATFGAVDAVIKLIPNTMAFGDYLTNTAIPAVLKFANAAWTGLIPALEATGLAMDASLGVPVLAAIVVFGQLGDHIQGIVNALGGWAQSWALFTQGIQLASWVMWGGLKAIFGGIGDLFKEAFRGVGDIAARIFWGVTDLAKGMWDGLIAIVKGSANLLIGIVNTIIGGMNAISIDVPGWVPGIGDKHFGVSIPEVPYLAAGAIATGPTLAMVGEGKHQEAILPLSDQVFSRLGQGIADHGGGGGVTLVINYTGSGSRQDVDAMAELLVKRLRRLGVGV